MQKFNLNALESANMKVANEEILSEINGGHTMRYIRTTSACGGSYEYWESVANGCGSGCPLGAAKFVKYWDYPNANKFKVRFDQGSNSGWIVEAYKGSQYCGTKHVSDYHYNDPEDHSFWHYMN